MIRNKNTNKEEIVLKNGSGYIIIGKGFLIATAIIVFAIMLILSVFAMGGYPRILNMTGSENGSIYVQDIDIVDNASISGNLSVVGFADYFNLVSKNNPFNYLYINGNETIEGSRRLSIDDVKDVAQIERLIDGVWNRASFKTGPKSLWVGERVGIAGVGHHLATEDSDGLFHFHSHSTFDGNISIGEATMIDAYTYFERFVAQPDNSGSFTGSILEYPAVGTLHSIVSRGYYQTDTTAATEPVRVRVWVGTNDTGDLAFDQKYPASLFVASSEISTAWDGYLEFDVGTNYFIRLNSDANFSLKMDSTDTYPWTAVDISLVREDDMLQTTEWVSGDNFTVGQWSIQNRSIYVSNTSGIQTGNFAGNLDKWNILGSTASFNVSEINYWSLNDTDLYYLDGNVGIGISNPSSALEVAGNIKIFDNKSLVFGEDANLVIQHTGGDTHLLNFEGGILFRNVPSDEDIKFILGSNDANTKMSVVKVDADSIIDMYGDGTVDIPNGDLIVNNDVLFVDVSSTHVGIGTNSPGARLHINQSEDGDDVMIRMENYDVATYWQFGITNDSAGRIFELQHNNIDTTETVLAANPTTHYIGIGTSEPQSLLHLESGDLDDTENLLALSNPSDSSNAGIGIEARFGSDTNNSDRASLSMVAGSGGTGELHFINDLNGTPTDRFTILENGYMGIGTTSPYYDLDVDGSIHMEDAYVFFDESTQEIASTPDGFGWYVTTASYLHNFSFVLQEANPQGLFFKPDGTKMYVIGDSWGVNEYKLSTAWDVSTAVYNQLFIGVFAQDSNPRGIFFRHDGLKMYMAGEDNDNVYEYNLSTAWDVSTLVYNQNFSITSQELLPEDLFFSPTGTKMYIVGRADDEVNEYKLSTAWDVSTATFNYNLDISSVDVAPRGLFFRSDGKKMYVVGSGDHDVNEFGLSTTWNISTAVLEREFNIVSEDSNPRAISFSPDGIKMYMAGDSAGNVYEYDLGFVALGNVGIGTSNPSTKLEVNGSVTIANNLSIDTDIFYVDSVNDHVGIGTSSPGTELEIEKDDSGTVIWERAGEIAIQNTNTLDGAWAGVQFMGAGSGIAAGIGAKFTDTSANYADLYFSTRDADGFNTNHMVLSEGEVGIGTNDPRIGLHVLTSGTSGLETIVEDRGIAITGLGGQSRLYFEATDSTSGERVFVINDDGGILNFGSMIDTANQWVNEYILSLDHDTGNVGIGISNSSNKLEVRSSSGDQFRIAYDFNDYHNFDIQSDGEMIWEQTGTDPDISIDFRGTGGDFSVNTDTFAVDTSTDRVGIGVAFPSAKLQISEAFSTTLPFDDEHALRIENTDPTNNNWGEIAFAESGSVAAGIAAQFTDHTNHYGELAFFTRGASGFAEHIRVAISGYVGIGTSNPGAKLDVATTGSDTVMRITADDAYDAVLRFFQNSGTKGIIGYDDSDDAIKMGYATTLENANSIVIDSSGNVGIGASNPITTLEINDDDSSTTTWSRPGEVIIQNTNATDNAWSGIEFQGSGGGISSGIAAQYTDTSANLANLVFSTRGASGFNRYNMVLSDGMVGVGKVPTKHSLEVSDGMSVINRVYVNSIDDLPDAVGGVITLEEQAYYMGDDAITITLTDELVFGVGAVMDGFTITTDSGISGIEDMEFRDSEVTFTGTGDFLTLTEANGGTRFLRTNLIMQSTGSATCFNFTTTNSNVYMVIDNVGIIGYVPFDMGKMDGMILISRDAQFLYFNSGLSLLNNDIIDIGTLSTLGVNSATNHLDIGGTTQGAIQISGYTPSIKSNEYGINFDNSTTYSTVSVLGSVPTGVTENFFKPGSYDQTETGFKFVGNTWIPDSTVKSKIYIQENDIYTTTISSAGVYVPLNGNWTLGTEERFNYTEDGNITYIGLEDVGVMALIRNDVQSAVNLQEIAIKIYKNDVPLNASTGVVMGSNSRSQSVYTQDLVELSTGDMLKLYVANNDGTGNVRLYSSNIIFSKV